MRECRAFITQELAAFSPDVSIFRWSVLANPSWQSVRESVAGSRERCIRAAERLASSREKGGLSARLRHTSRPEDYSNTAKCRARLFLKGRLRRTQQILLDPDCRRNRLLDDLFSALSHICTAS